MGNFISKTLIYCNIKKSHLSKINKFELFTLANEIHDTFRTGCNIIMPLPQGKEKKINKYKFNLSSWVQSIFKILCNARLKKMINRLITDHCRLKLIIKI